MAWNPFKKKESEPESENKELLNRIETALRKAKDEKREAERQIREIRGWAQDAIIDVYADFFENSHLTYYREQHKEKAIEKYEAIKAEHASKLDAETVEKGDRIVQGYLNQIALRESKLQLYDKMVAEYEKSKQKLRHAKTRGKSVSNLQEHADRLNKLDDSAEHIRESMTDSYELEDIQNELAVREEYFKQLEILNNQFDNDSDYNNANMYKDEVDKMIKKIK